MPRALFLCSGTGSVGEPFREAGWEVVDVDWDGRYGAEVQEDIMTWDYKAFAPGTFQLVWASPDCAQYSIARKRAATPRDFPTADALVQKCLEIIEYLDPPMWFLENPDTGYLKTREFMQGIPFVRVDECMYGTSHRKRTRLWCNSEACSTWTPNMCDKSHCIAIHRPRCTVYRHETSAQRGYPSARIREDRAAGITGQSRHYSRDALHRLPRALCDEIFAQACLV